MDQNEPASAIDKISKSDITERKGTATKTLTTDNPENTGGVLNDASPVVQIPCEEIPYDEGRLQEQNRAANRKVFETEFPSKMNPTEDFKKELEQKLEQAQQSMHMDQKNFTNIKQAVHDSGVEYGNLAPGKPSDTLSEGGKGDDAAENCSSTPDIIIPSCPRTEEHGDHTNTEQNNSRITDAETVDETKPLAVNEDAGKGSHSDRATELDEKAITGDKNKIDMKEDSHPQEMTERISVLEIDPLHVTGRIENKEMKNTQLSSGEDNIFGSTIEVDGNEKEKLVEINANDISDECISAPNNNASGRRVGEACPSDVHLNLPKDHQFHYAEKETVVNKHPDPDNNYASESLHKEQSTDQAKHESTQFMMGSRELDLRTEKPEKSIDSNETCKVLQKMDAKENQIVEKNLNNQNYEEPNSEVVESTVNQSLMTEENLDNLLLDEMPIQHIMEKSEVHPGLHMEKKESETANANKNEETEKMASTIKDEGLEMPCAKQGYEALEQDIASDKFLVAVTGKDSFEEGETETPVCTSCTTMKEDLVDSHSDKNENRKEEYTDRSEDTQQEREKEDLLDQKVTTELMQEAKAPLKDDLNKESEVSNANNDIVLRETLADSSDTTNLESDGLYSKDKKVDGGSDNTLSSERTQKARDVTEAADENCSASHFDKADQTPNAALSENPQNSIEGERNKVNSDSGKDVSAGHDSSVESLCICKSKEEAEAEQEANTNDMNDGNDDFDSLSAQTQDEKEKRKVDGEEADQLYAKEECNNNNDKETPVDGNNTKCSILEHQNSKTIAVTQDVVVSNIFLEKDQEDKRVENSDAAPVKPENVVIKQEMHTPMENPQNLNLNKEPSDSPTVEVEIAPSTNPAMDNPDTHHKNQAEIVKIDEQIFIGKGETQNKTRGNEAETESEGISSETQTHHEVSGRLSSNGAAPESSTEKESDNRRCRSMPSEVPEKEESTTFQEKEPLDDKLEDQHGSESGTVIGRLILNEVVSESLVEKDDGRRSDLPVEDDNVTFQVNVLQDNKMNEEPVPDTVVHTSTSAIKQNDGQTNPSIKEEVHSMKEKNAHPRTTGAFIVHNTEENIIRKQSKGNEEESEPRDNLDGESAAPKNDARRDKQNKEHGQEKKEHQRITAEVTLGTTDESKVSQAQRMEFGDQVGDLPVTQASFIEALHANDQVYVETPSLHCEDQVQEKNVGGTSAIEVAQECEKKISNQEKEAAFYDLDVHAKNEVYHPKDELKDVTTQKQNSGTKRSEVSHMLAEGNIDGEFKISKTKAHELETEKSSNNNGENEKTTDSAVQERGESGNNQDQKSTESDMDITNVGSKTVTESDMEPQEKNKLDGSYEVSEAKKSIDEVQKKSLHIPYIEKEQVDRHVTANSCDKFGNETHSSAPEGTPDNYLVEEKDHHEMSASSERVEEQGSASSSAEVKGKEAETNYTVKTVNNEEVKNDHERPLEQDDSMKDSTEVKTLIAEDVKPDNNIIISIDTKEATTATSKTTVQQETANHEEKSTSSEIACGVIAPEKKDVQFATHTTECEESSTELMKLESLISGLVIDDIADDMDQKEETLNKLSNAQITSSVAEPGEERDNEEKDQASRITFVQQMEGTAVNPDNDVKDRETLPIANSSQVTKDLHVVKTTGKPWEDFEILKPSDPQNDSIVEDLPVSQFLLDQIFRGNSLEDASVPHVRAKANEDTNTNENNTNSPGKEATEELKAETRIPNNDTKFLEKTEKDSSPPLKQGNCNVIDKANNSQKDAGMDVKELESQFSAKQVNEHANNEESLHSLSEESKDVLNVNNEKEEVIKAKTPEKVPSCAIPTEELKVHAAIADNDKETLEMSEINSQQPLKQAAQNMIDEVKDGRGDTAPHGEVIGSLFFAKEADEHPKDQECSHIVTKESKGNCQANDTMLSTVKASNPGVNEAAKEVYILRQVSDGPDGIVGAPNFETREKGNSLTSNLDITMTTKLLKEVVMPNEDGQSIRATKEVPPNVEIPERKLIESGATAVTESVTIQGVQAFVKHEEALESMPCRQEAHPQSSAIEDKQYGAAPGDGSEKKDAQLLGCKQTASTEVSSTANKTSNIDARESQPCELYPPSIHQEPLSSMPADSEVISEKEMIAGKKEKLGSQIDSPMDEKESVWEKDKKNIMDQKMEEDEAESLLMEEFRGPDLKQQQKKHHNILSGVGSKVKHSILTKVKKAITCTSVELPK